ncbi:unnamed protein product [Tenebrio molitor]|nr:unnamed protein product [Tenebrio molitor]
MLHCNKGIFISQEVDIRMNRLSKQILLMLLTGFPRTAAATPSVSTAAATSVSATATMSTAAASTRR